MEHPARKLLFAGYGLTMSMRSPPRLRSGAACQPFQGAPGWIDLPQPGTAGNPPRTGEVK
jgi:hypothetical protein